MKITFLEKIFAMSFIILVLFLIIFSHLKKENYYPKNDNLIVVVVEGEVERPGKYEFNRNVALKEIANEAGVKKTADFSKSLSKKIIKSSCKLYFPSKNKKHKKNI